MRNILPRTEQGFTLVEVVIALGVLSFGILTLMLLQLSAIRGNDTSSTISTESNWAADRIELFLNLDYFHADLTDTDNDGTNQDWDGDGIDDDGQSFGLNDIGVSTAAGCTAAPADNCVRKGQYDIFWNVAVDHPVPNTKKIKVIVKHNLGKDNVVEFEYVKADVI